MAEDETAQRRHLNRDAKRVPRAETIRRFLTLYARKAQKGVEPNDRRYARDVERKVKRMRPETLDAILRDGEDELEK